MVCQRATLSHCGACAAGSVSAPPQTRSAAAPRGEQGRAAGVVALLCRFQLLGYFSVSAANFKLSFRTVFMLSLSVTVETLLCCGFSYLL